MKTGGRLRADIVTNLAKLEHLRAAWDALVGVAPGDTVYTTPAWVLTWYRHFAGADGIRAVTVWDGDDLTAIAPFCCYSPDRPALKFELWSSAASEHGYYGEPLLGRSPETSARAIAGCLAERVAQGTVAVNLRRLWLDGPMRRAVDERPDLDCRPMAPPAESAVVAFDEEPDPEQFLHRLARKHGVPRRARRLAEAFADVTYLPDDPDIEGALADMERMLKQRWELAGPTQFRGEQLTRFTKAVLRALAADGHLRMSSLKADGRRLALSVVFQVGDTAVGEYSAFDPDPELAKFGVGQQERYEVLSHAHRNGVVRVDTLPVGDHEYKLKWTNTTHTSQSVSVTATGKRGQIARVARRVAMSRHAHHMHDRERSLHSPR